MPGDRVHISHADMWHATQMWIQQHQSIGASSGTLQEFECACGLMFERYMRQKSGERVYEYHVQDAHRLMLSIARYGWRVTPISTT